MDSCSRLCYSWIAPDRCYSFPKTMFIIGKPLRERTPNFWNIWRQQIVQNSNELMIKGKGRKKNLSWINVSCCCWWWWWCQGEATPQAWSEPTHLRQVHSIISHSTTTVTASRQRCPSLDDLSQYVLCMCRCCFTTIVINLSNTGTVLEGKESASFFGS